MRNIKHTLVSSTALHLTRRRWKPRGLVARIFLWKPYMASYSIPTVYPPTANPKPKTTRSRVNEAHCLSLRPGHEATGAPSKPKRGKSKLNVRTSESLLDTVCLKSFSCCAQHNTGWVCFVYEELARLKSTQACQATQTLSPIELNSLPIT